MTEDNRPIRIFIAIPVPESVAGRVIDVIETLRPDFFPGARWIRHDQIHITVKFLGDTDQTEISRISQSLDDFSIDQTAYTLKFGKLGAFPNRTSPRVVWLGTNSVPERHLELVAGVENRMVQLGFLAESKPSTIHLTLARIRNPVRTPWPPDDYFVKLFDNIPDFNVNSLQLLASTLLASGARYRLLHEIHFS